MSGNLFYFFRGMNEMGDSLQREEHNRMRNEELRDAQTKRKETDALNKKADDYVTSMSARGVNQLEDAPGADVESDPVPTTAGPIGSRDQPPTMAPMPEPAGPIGSRDAPPPAAAPAAPAPPPAAMPKVKVTAKSKPDDYSERFRLRREFFLQNNRQDLAEQTDAAWAKHLNAQLERYTKETIRLTQGDAREIEVAGHQQKLAEMTQGAIGTAFQMVQNPLTKAQGLESISSIVGQEVTGLAGQRDGGVVVLGQGGQPLMGADGKPMVIPREQYAKLTGITAGKITELAKGAKAFRQTSDGRMVEVASNPDPGEGGQLKPSDKLARVKQAQEEIGLAFGLKKGELGALMGSIKAGEEDRYYQALQEMEQRVNAGEPPLAVVQDVTDRYRRSKVTGDPALPAPGPKPSGGGASGGWGKKFGF